MTKKVRGPQNMLKMTYADIAELAGIKPRTAREYAHKGQFDPADFRSVLAFITKHRAKRGLSPIGHEQGAESEPAAACPHCGKQIVIKAR